MIKIGEGNTILYDMLQKLDQNSSRYTIFKSKSSK